MKQNTINTFDVNADIMVDMYDELPLWSAPFGLKLLDHVEIKNDVTALDIGFGTGFPLLELAMRLGDSSKVYGIDPWQAAIRRTSKKIKYYGINNTELISGTAENIPLPNNSVDLIVSNNGLNNVVDMERALMECARIAKKDSQFVMTMNLDTTMAELFEIFRAVLKKMGLAAYEKKIEELIYNKRKPISEIETLLKENGFRIEQSEKSVFEYKFTNANALFKHYFIRLAFLDDWKKIPPVDKQTKFFDNVEHNVNKVAKKQGFFKLTIPFITINSFKD